MKATSEKYQQLYVYDAGVRFVAGAAEVTAKQAAILRKLPADMGVTVAGKTEPEPKDDSKTSDKDDKAPDAKKTGS